MSELLFKVFSLYLFIFLSMSTKPTIPGLFNSNGINVIFEN